MKTNYPETNEQVNTIIDSICNLVDPLSAILNYSEDALEEINSGNSDFDYKIRFEQIVKCTLRCTDILKSIREQKYK